MNAQSPAVVIAARSQLIAEIAEVGGERMTVKSCENIADYLIAKGRVADAYFDEVALSGGEGSNP